jgi:uncharacterized protein (TIGR03083 family)
VPFGEACDLAIGVVADSQVGERWAEPSALAGLSVGGLAAHLYAATRRFEVALDEPMSSAPKVVALADFYGRNRVDDASDLDAGWHPMVREDAERRAAHGHAAVVQRFREVVARLDERLPGASPDRLVPVWTIPNGATSLEAYVATRVVELVLHSDDLAASVELPIEVPSRAASSVVATLVDLARARVGDLQVMRAFARAERAAPDALRVL